MKFALSSFLLALIVATVYGSHTFLGASVNRTLAHNVRVQYSSKIMQKRVEYWNYNLPVFGRSIQGILAYDETKSAASANVTSGGIGFNYVQLRMKSDRGKAIKYDVFIYM